MSKFSDGLKALAFTDDQITQIIKVKNESGEDIPKYRFDEVNAKKNELEERLANQEKQFKELEKGVGENETLKAQLEEMKKQREQDKTEATKKFKEYVRHQNLVMYLVDECHNPEDIIRNLKMGDISFDENNKPISGLDNQIEALKATSPYYFKEKQPQGDGVINTHKPDGSNGDNGDGGADDGFFTDSLFDDNK